MYIVQSFAKKNCQEVGKHTLQIVVELLKENGEPDEYIDALDLISRLVNPKYGDDARENATILLDDVMTVELLLDLLEHEDGLVAVMASEILTNVHSLESIRLESMIQLCPAGMTKLLNRVPDRSREEVSNQAIILIQQLTVSNEEMKKAVAFNEVRFMTSKRLLDDCCLDTVSTTQHHNRVFSLSFFLFSDTCLVGI